MKIKNTLLVLLAVAALAGALVLGMSKSKKTSIPTPVAQESIENAGGEGMCCPVLPGNIPQLVCGNTCCNAQTSICGHNLAGNPVCVARCLPGQYRCYGTDKWDGATVCVANQNQCHHTYVPENIWKKDPKCGAHFENGKQVPDGSNLPYIEGRPVNSKTNQAVGCNGAPTASNNIFDSFNKSAQFKSISKPSPSKGGANTVCEYTDKVTGAKLSVCCGNPAQKDCQYNLQGIPLCDDKCGTGHWGEENTQKCSGKGTFGKSYTCCKATDTCGFVDPTKANSAAKCVASNDCADPATPYLCGGGRSINTCCKSEAECSHRYMGISECKECKSPTSKVCRVEAVQGYSTIEACCNPDEECLFISDNNAFDPEIGCIKCDPAHICRGKGPYQNTISCCKDGEECVVDGAKPTCKKLCPGSGYNDGPDQTQICKNRYDNGRVRCCLPSDRCTDGGRCCPSGENYQVCPGIWTYGLEEGCCATKKDDGTSLSCGQLSNDDNLKQEYCQADRR